MAIVVANRLGKQVAQALGLQTERLHSIELRIAPDEVVTARCEYYASDDDGKLSKVLKHYELHERIEPPSLLAAGCLCGEYGEGRLTCPLHKPEPSPQR